MPPQNEENNWQFDHKIWINHWLRWITSAPVISKRNRVGAFMEYKEFSFFSLCKDFYFYTELSFSKTTKKYILKIAADWLKYCGIYRFVQTWTNGNCFSFVIKRIWICSPTIIWPERVRTSFSSQFIALNTVVGVQSLSAARSVLQWIRRVDTQLNFLHISWALTFFSRFFRVQPNELFIDGGHLWNNIKSYWNFSALPFRLRSHRFVVVDSSICIRIGNCRNWFNRNRRQFVLFRKHI